MSLRITTDRILSPRKNAHDQEEVSEETRKTCSLGRVLFVVGSGIAGWLYGGALLSAIKTTVIVGGCTLIVDRICLYYQNPLPPHPVKEEERSEASSESEQKVAFDAELPIRECERGRLLLAQADQFKLDAWRSDNNYKENIQKALELYKQAVQLKYSPAYKKFGDCCRFGIGMPPNSKLAFEMFTLGDAAGNLECSKSLGDMYLHGLGTKANIKIGLALHQKASQNKL